MFARLFTILALILTLWGCQKEDGHPSTPETKEPPRPLATAPLSPAVPLTAPVFLSKPINATLVESTNEALPIWRRYAKNRPLLAIVAQGPALVSIPKEKFDDSKTLLASADDGILKKRTGLNDPDPVFLPPMSVTAALDAGWIDGVIWIFPTSGAPETINPELFRQQIVEAGIATTAEAQGLVFEAGVFRGNVRGRPFLAAPLKALPAVEQPVLLHIDCDYFKTLYKGEIKTPLYPLLIETLTAMGERQWKVAEVSVARSTLGGLPLATRFVAGQLADIVTDPEMLARPLPDNWTERANALYLENFLQKDKVRDIYLDLVKEDPADPSLRYALYQSYRQYAKGGDEALEHLQVAVQIDPVYALEYSALSELAAQKQLPAQSLKMLRLARAARPDDPFILMLLARTLLNSGDRSNSATIQAELQKINWSTIYYPEQGEARDGLVNLLKN